MKLLLSLQVSHLLVFIFIFLVRECITEKANLLILSLILKCCDDVRYDDIRCDTIKIWGGGEGRRKERRGEERRGEVRRGEWRTCRGMDDNV